MEEVACVSMREEEGAVHEAMVKCKTRVNLLGVVIHFVPLPMMMYENEIWG